VNAPDPDPGRAQPSPLRRVLLVLLLCGVVAVIAASDTLHGPLERLLAVTERMIAANPIAGATLFVLFAALSGMLAFFSSAMIVPVAVYAFGPLPSAAMLWFGWILGGALTYALGRWLGRPIARRLTAKGLARYEQRISRDTPFGLVALFQLAMPSEVPGYVLGLVRYSFLRYILVVAAGELPYAIGTVLLGQSFIERRVLPFVVLGIGGALLSAWAYAWLNRRMARAPLTAAEAPAAQR
jgi:uncharacterized membrane protein YdjX (TVP38/TMEM64 family)